MEERVYLAEKQCFAAVLLAVNPAKEEKNTSDSLIYTYTGRKTAGFTTKTKGDHAVVFALQIRQFVLIIAVLMDGSDNLSVKGNALWPGLHFDIFG